MYVLSVSVRMQQNRLYRKSKDWILYITWLYYAIQINIHTYMSIGCVVTSVLLPSCPCFMRFSLFSLFFDSSNGFPYKVQESWVSHIFQKFLPIYPTTEYMLFWLELRYWLSRVEELELGSCISLERRMLVAGLLLLVLNLMYTAPALTFTLLLSFCHVVSLDIGIYSLHLNFTLRTFKSVQH